MMTNEFENQLDEIRVQLYEETKHMSNADAVKAANESGKRIADQFGISLVKSAEHQPAMRKNIQ